MALSTSRLSYTDCFEAMDKALEDGKGARMAVEDHSIAVYQRMRLNQARSIDRRDNKGVYEPGAPLYGRSAYDTLTFRLKEDTEGTWWIYLEVNMINALDIEALSELE